MLNAPFIHTAPSIQRLMGTVLIALLPGIAIHVWQFGAALLIQLLVATITALTCEALVLALRRRPLRHSLLDGSAVVTAALIALSLPPLVPWWLTALACGCAILLAKQLYGGLGQNPFNPAMAAFAMMIIAYPLLMSRWPVNVLDFELQWQIIWQGGDALDAIGSATVLNSVHNAIHQGVPISTALAQLPDNVISARQWINLGYLLGGLLLIQQKIIRWQEPALFLTVFAFFATLFWLGNGERFASPWLHLNSGAVIFAAFFILTDPVSGATSPRGKILFAGGAAILVYLIRTFGAFPDGVAFAILLMNLCVPIIDRQTQPPVFGHTGTPRS